MDVFVSHSGARSHAAAEALREWLPMVINAINPWISSVDIEKGANWTTELNCSLAKCKFGIICLTKGNLHADWVLFESGALSKALDTARVGILLLDLKPTEVQGPLAQFQATMANKTDMKKLLAAMNSSVAESGERALGETQLNVTFEKWWPELEGKLQSLPTEAHGDSPNRSDRELLEEILQWVRRPSSPLGRYAGSPAIQDELFKHRSTALKDALVWSAGLINPITRLEVLRGLLDTETEETRDEKDSGSKSG